MANTRISYDGTCTCKAHVKNTRTEIKGYFSFFSRKSKNRLRAGEVILASPDSAKSQTRPCLLFFSFSFKKRKAGKKSARHVLIEKAKSVNQNYKN